MQRFLKFLKVSVRYHIKIFREWQSSNHRVSLKLSDLELNTNLEMHLLSSNNSSPETRFQTNLNHCSPRVDINLAARHLSLGDQCVTNDEKSKDNSISDLGKHNTYIQYTASSPKANISNDNVAFVSDCVIEINK